ncbi:polyprenyl synthetase family protein, partial [Deinococcus pimensis]|uniref:polyprenyl synthetase family protein n=1 Tax=Deinococcus pimensis TaxID=309888 RepID=UPI000483A0BE
ALHREHGVPLAVNAGDALHAYMWAAVLRADTPGAFEETLRMIHRTAEGQHVDLAWVEHGRWDLTPDDYLEMVRLKTGWYTVVTPLRLGALATGVTPPHAFEAAGLDLGVAFQIRDDVLNLVGDAAAYGKEIAGDLLEGKRTLIALGWLGRATGEQRGVFLAEMAKSRADKDPDTIARLLGWMRESGAVEDAMRVAHDHAARGLSGLRAALADAPDPQAAGHLFGLMEQLATREK